MNTCVLPFMDTKMTETELMVQDCMNRLHKLNEWEEGFISSIAHSADNLSVMQLAKLEEIWDRIT